MVFAPGEARRMANTSFNVVLAVDLLGVETVMLAAEDSNVVDRGRAFGIGMIVLELPT